MTGVGDNFRWNVLWGSAEGPGLVTDWNSFGEPEINQSEVSVDVEHQIFRFEISVHDSSLVEVSEGFDHTRDVESGYGVRKWASRVEKSPEIAAEVRVG